MAVSISLDDDAALVLFDVLASGKLDLQGLSLPERKAVTLLLGALETQLGGPLTENYRQHLAIASLAIIGRYGP